MPDSLSEAVEVDVMEVYFAILLSTCAGQPPAVWCRGSLPHQMLTYSTPPVCIAVSATLPTLRSLF